MNEPDYDFLNEPAPDVVEPVTPDPAPVAPVETATAPEPEAPAAPTAAPPREESHVPLAALKAEREKRQQYERRLAELEAAQNKAPEPNFYEAPEQYVQHIVQSERQQMARALYEALEADVREEHPDYDEIVNELAEAAQSNPLIAHQIRSSPNPARAAYRMGKQMREFQAMKDPAEYRKGIEAEIRKQVEAEYAAKDAKRAETAAAIPPDLAAARSATTAEPEAEMTLDSILKSRKR